MGEVVPLISPSPSPISFLVMGGGKKIGLVGENERKSGWERWFLSFHLHPHPFPFL